MGNHTSRGQQRDKPYLVALRMEIAAAGEDSKALRRIAKAHLEKAAAGDIAAIKELADRLDGKVPQAVTGEDGGPIEIEHSDAKDRLAHLLASEVAAEEASSSAGGADK